MLLHEKLTYEIALHIGIGYMPPNTRRLSSRNSSCVANLTGKIGSMATLYSGNVGIAPSRV